MGCVILLELDENGVLHDPLPGRAEPDTMVGFVLMLSEQATDKFLVKIDFDDIVLKHDRTQKHNPFIKGGPHSRQLKPGEIDLIDQKMRAASEFVPAGGLPYTTYKYTVIVKNIDTGVTHPPFDPDIDVPPR